MIASHHEGECVVGVDIGKTNVTSVLADDSGKVLASDTRRTRADNGVQAGLATIMGSIAVVARESGEKRIGAIGIGCAGPLDTGTGTVVSWFGLPGWRNVPIRDMVGRESDLPVFIDNDANSAALGEGWVGAAAGIDSFVCVTLGTGLGTGIISGGRVLRGAGGMAGEGGHMTIAVRGLTCTCGHRGCLQAYVSATAIVRRTEQALQRGAASCLAGGASRGVLTAEMVHEAALAGDRMACEVMERTGCYLGIGLANLVCLLDPQMVVLAGGVSAAGMMVARAEKEIRMRIAPFRRVPPQVVTGKLGTSAGAIGAARLAWDGIDGVGGPRVGWRPKDPAERSS